MPAPMRDYPIYLDHDQKFLIGSVTIYDERLTDEHLTRLAAVPAYEVKNGKRKMFAYGFVKAPDSEIKQMQ